MAITGSPSNLNKTRNAELVSAVTSALEPVAADAGFDLEDVEITPAGRRRLLRVVVDRDGGLDLDAVAEASRAFGVALDTSDVMGELPYVLEVSSPGVDRPLRLPRHWRRAVGRIVEARLHDGTKVRGRVVAADDVSATFHVDGADRVIDLSDLGDGRVQLEFEHARGGDA